MPEPKSVVGLMTFFAKKHSGELCGSNGLPLTPNSITIYGESQILKSITHPNLCEYLDVIRGKHERMIVVSEYHNQSLSNVLRDGLSLSRIKEIAWAVVSGLSCLHSDYAITHGALSPENIVFSNGDVKLFNYGMYHMTHYGASVPFPIGAPKYMAPESLLLCDKTPRGPKTDTWSLGMILAEIVLGGKLWPDLKLGQLIRRALSLIHATGPVLERLANEHNCIHLYESLDPKLKDFINTCLTIDVSKRPTPNQCQSHELFSDLNDKMAIYGENDVGIHIGFLQRVSAKNAGMHLKLKQSRIAEAERVYKKFDDWCYRELAKRSLKERYFLWQLAGGDVYSELKRQGMIKSKPPILSIPKLVVVEGTWFGDVRDIAFLLDMRIVGLDMSGLESRIARAQLPFDAFYPLILEPNPDSDPDPAGVASLPLVIREKDIEYQFHRVILYHRLLLGYPTTRQKIVKEATRDVTPFFRGDIWASLLGIQGDIQGRYDAIDKETASATDRQIDVDIPRCHQYNELLASSAGHRKLKRILKAWVISNPQYVYWQGLDSLCAPFLYLNFNNEAQAYACLSAFIPKYLHEFFLKDNSSVIKEYLAKFRHLVAFQDPELACHLDEIHFIPELFAIPWFLTVFSHVFPLHKILYLWDELLLGGSSFPLHVGLAILQQLRDTLLASGFNESILLFSDLPEIDIERCVRDARRFNNDTPPSILFRKHGQPEKPTDSILDIPSSGIPISQLCAEFSPRISAADLLNLLKTEKVKVIDIRSYEEHRICSIPGSISLPFNLLPLSQQEIPDSKEGRELDQARGQILVVVGSGDSGGENLAEFCSWLVHRQFPFVCSLHGGINNLITGKYF